jgi:hypothetical protein
MSQILVPYKSPFSGLEASRLKFQNSNFLKNRNLLIRELRYLSTIPAIYAELKLNPETVYKIVNTPEGGELFKDVAGNYKGVFYKDGKIIQHAKLKTISPSMVKAASAIGSQILLISIAMQLNRIERSIERIINELHNDRLSEIEAGIEQFEEAMLVQNKNTQKLLLANVPQSLNFGLKKTFRSLKQQIESMPEVQISRFDNWGGKSKSRYADEKIRPAAESFFTCLLGIRTLSECFAVLNEPIAAEQVLNKNLSYLRDTGIESAAKKARLVRAQGNTLPETPWREFVSCRPVLMESLSSCKALKEESIESIAIEFKPKELFHENM